jgi:hypothetical protein
VPPLRRCIALLTSLPADLDSLAMRGLRSKAAKRKQWLDVPRWPEDRGVRLDAGFANATQITCASAWPF